MDIEGPVVEHSLVISVGIPLFFVYRDSDPLGLVDPQFDVERSIGQVVKPDVMNHPIGSRQGREKTFVVDGKTDRNRGTEGPIIDEGDQPLKLIGHTWFDPDLDLPTEPLLVLEKLPFEVRQTCTNGA
jgi:hypothetical protein